MYLLARHHQRLLKKDGKKYKKCHGNDMAIKPKCDKCKKELKEFGGILLSPPKKNMVKKFHLCKQCYKIFERIVGQKK